MFDARMNRKPVSRRVSAAAVTLLLGIMLPRAVLRVSAQTKPSTLSGFTQDQLDHRIVGVSVAATNTRTGFKYEAKTDRFGSFEFVGIPAADYVLQARFPGFSTFVDVVSMGGADVQRTVTLELAVIEETVTVTDEDVTPTVSDRAAEASKRAADGSNDRCTEPAAGGCIEPPVPIRHVRPKYVGIDGKVVLQGEIGVDGVVRQLESVTEADPALASAAIDAVSQWRFAPTRLDGVAVETALMVTTYFKAATPPAPPR